MKKKIISLFMAAVTLFCLLSIPVSARYTYISSFSANVTKGNGVVDYRGDVSVRPTDEKVTLKVYLQESSDRVSWTTVASKTREYTPMIGGGGLFGTYTNPISGKYYRCLTTVWIGDINNPIDYGSVNKIIQY